MIPFNNLHSQFMRKSCVPYTAADLQPDSSERLDVFEVDFRQSSGYKRIQFVGLNKMPVGVHGDDETLRDINTQWRKVLDHLPQGSIFTPYPFHVSDAHFAQAHYMFAL